MASMCASQAATLQLNNAKNTRALPISRSLGAISGVHAAPQIQR